MSESNEETEANSDDADAGAVDTGPVAGGTLLIQSTQVPRHLNGTVQSGYATAVPGTQLNASPLLIDEDFQPQPYLAESWEVAEDGLSVTLNLVEGAVFHDGEAITSEALGSKGRSSTQCTKASADTYSRPRLVELSSLNGNNVRFPCSGDNVEEISISKGRLERRLV